MSAMNDGGPAFPTDYFYDEKHIGVQRGMSLRDYFAAAALPAIVASRCAQGDDISQESIAEECYELADAMLEALVKS